MTSKGPFQPKAFCDLWFSLILARPADNQKNTAPSDFCLPLELGSPKGEQDTYPYRFLLIISLMGLLI